MTEERAEQPASYNQMVTSAADILIEHFARAVQSCSVAAMVEQSPLVASLRSEPVDLVAVGKCAVAGYEALRGRLSVQNALVVVPRGYGELQSSGVEVIYSSHPLVSADSFQAGDRLQQFVRQGTGPLLVFLSGGSSAAVELPLTPWITRETIEALQHPLLDHGLGIAEINTVRKHLSAIKGGRLAASSSRPMFSVVVSDVDPESPHHVGSGPTMPDPSSNGEAAAILERLKLSVARQLASRLRSGEIPDTPKSLSNSRWEVVGDNSSLQRAAITGLSVSGWSVQASDVPCSDDVETVSSRLADLAQRLHPGTIVVAGGEPTVKVAEEKGRGGRCSELAVRLAMQLRAREIGGVTALFGASDGVDGSSGAAGCVIESALYEGLSPLQAEQIEAAIRHSDTISAVPIVGRPFRIGVTGNNLRDLFILARS